MESYLRDPEAIMRLSFERLQKTYEWSSVTPSLRSIAQRLVHACAMPDIVPDLAWQGAVVEAGHDALRAGRPILADCAMVEAGITKRMLPTHTDVLCFLDDPTVPDLAKKNGTTRSAAAVDLWQPHLEGAIVAIGNAPTALFRLLELLREGAPSPAVILAFPVGFVGAAESKQALAQEGTLETPWLTLLGRRGGSSLAVAAVNGLALSLGVTHEERAAP
ncbi:MAG: precorrin-8X methylmutase [Parvularculales bacterium]